MINRYVLYSQERGVFLGHCLGFGFWSKLDPAGQTDACTFDSPEEIAAFVQSFEPGLNDWTPVQVQMGENGYATMDDCMMAGLPGWAINLP